MRIRYSYILAFILTSISIAFGQQTINDQTVQTKQIEKTDVRLQNLKKQAELLVETQRKNDFEKSIKLTHPLVIDKVGGNEKLNSMIRRVNEQIPVVFESYSLTVEDPTVLVESKEELFGVVPLKAEGVTHQKNKIVSNDCMVGVSGDNGTTWKFVSGEKFEEFFPSAKGKIQIIKQKIFVNGIEQ